MPPRCKRPQFLKATQTLFKGSNRMNQDLTRESGSGAAVFKTSLPWPKDVALTLHRFPSFLPQIRIQLIPPKSVDAYLRVARNLAAAANCHSRPLRRLEAL